MVPGRKQSHDSTVVSLHNGDSMPREEFHRYYSQMPPNYRAELIGGIVFEPSPVSYAHGSHHVELSYLLETYSRMTLGTGVVDNATLILSEEDEVQPDLVLRKISGGRSLLTANGYLEGAPELVAEIAYSSRAIDLHLKKERYAAAGVGEYIVVCLRPKKLYWFDMKEPAGKRGQGIAANHEGILKSRIFPGLWIHQQALLELDKKLAMEVLLRGIAASG